MTAGAVNTPEFSSTPAEMTTSDPAGGVKLADAIVSDVLLVRSAAAGVEASSAIGMRAQPPSLLAPDAALSWPPRRSPRR